MSARELRSLSARGTTPGASANTRGATPGASLGNTQSTLEALGVAEKLEAARIRIAELEAEARARAELEVMQDRIRQLEGASLSTAPIRDPIVSTAVTPLRRAPKTRELPIYKGKTIKDAQDFFYQAELKWREDDDITWSTDAAKVTHCVSCFSGIARDVWKRRERLVGVDNTNWEEFVEFMKDAISDPSNRSLDAIKRHDTAQQRSYQSVQSFVSYLDSLEDELGYTDDLQRRNFLLAKLKPEIRQEVDRQGEIPTRRERLISLAIRIENH